MSRPAFRPAVKPAVQAAPSHLRRPFGLALTRLCALALVFAAALTISACTTSSGGDSSWSHLNPWEREVEQTNATEQPRVIDPFGYYNSSGVPQQTQAQGQTAGQPLPQTPGQTLGAARTMQVGPYGAAQPYPPAEGLLAPDTTVFGGTPPYGQPLPGTAGTSGYTSAPLAPMAPQQAAPSNATKVAILLPLSGRHKDLGQSLLQAAQLALFDMNVGNLELVPRDTQGTATGAAKAAQEAVSSGASLILGPLFADEVRAAKPVTQSAGLTMIGFSTDWRVAGGNTFIMGVLPFAQAERIAEFAARKNLRRVGIIAPRNEYGDAVVNAFQSKAARLGITIPDTVRFDPDSHNLSDDIARFSRYENRSAALETEKTQLTAQLAANPHNAAAKARLAELEASLTGGNAPFDAIFLPVGGQQGKELFNVLAYYDLGPDKVQYLGTGLWDDTAIQSEPALRGGLYAAPSPQQRAEFEVNYMNTYGAQPPRLVSIAYDATALAAVLARQGQAYGRPDFSAQAIINPNGFAGIDGIFRFRPDGIIQRGLAVHRIDGGRSTVVDPAPVTFQSGDY